MLLLEPNSAFLNYIMDTKNKENLQYLSTESLRYMALTVQFRALI